MFKRFGFAAIAAALSLSAAPALAQTFPIKMASYQKAYFKGFTSVVLPSYNVTFITSNQATAVGGGARARLTKTLVGVDEATMRRLADEAHADLRAQFVAAGLPVASDETAQAMVAANTIPLQPDNKEVFDGSGGVTINKSLRQSYISVGPKAAPMLAPYRPNMPANGSNVAAMTPFNNRLAKGQPDGALTVIPNLVLDFANVGAEVSSGRRNTASAGGQTAFSYRGVPSGIFFTKVYGGGRIFPFFIRPEGDTTLPTPFALDVAGAASVAPVTPLGETIERGDAVFVNVPVWEGLVRTAYRSHNAAIVAAAMGGK